MKKESDGNRCSRCNSIKLFEDIDKRTGEGFVMCIDCGYNHTLKWKQNENGDFVRIDKSKGISPDNVIIEKTEVEFPFGSYVTRTSKGHYEFGILQESEDCDSLRQYISDIMPYNKDTEIKVNKCINGEIVSEYLL